MTEPGPRTRARMNAVAADDDRRAAHDDEAQMMNTQNSTRDGDPALDDEPTSWHPVDLTAALTGLDVPPPELGRRTDGAPLLYRGRTHWFIGESETCKSWAALVIARQVLDAGGRVMWVDFEDDDRGVVARLRSLGTDAEAIHARFVYLQPEEPLVTSSGKATAGNAALGELLAGDPFDLAVVDGVTDAMVTEGLDLRDNADVANWTRRLPKRIARTGAAVVCIDHLPKSRDTNTRDAIGGQHKRAGTTGAAYRFDLVRPFARPAGSDPSEGRVDLVVTKDRPGHVRGRAVGNRIAVLELTGYPDGSVAIALVDPDAAATGRPDLTLVRDVAEHLAVYDGASWRNLADAVRGRDETIREVVRWMVEQGWLTVTRTGQTHRHSLTDEGRRECLD